MDESPLDESPLDESLQDAAEGARTGEPASKVQSESEQSEKKPASELARSMEFFLGGQVQEIIWSENRATLRAGVLLSDISDKELEKMDLKRNEITDSPYPENFFDFVQIDGKWLFDGVNTEKSLDSLKTTLQKFPSSEMEPSMPLIADIQISGVAVSGKQLALSD